MDDTKTPGPAPEMPMYEKTLAQARLAGSVEVSALPHRPTVSEMLLAKKQYLEEQLQLINDALKKAEAQPGTMKLIDAIAKTQIKQDY